MSFNTYRCKNGAEAARALALGAKTTGERERWERQEKVWISRWKNSLPPTRTEPS